MAESRGLGDVYKRQLTFIAQVRDVTAIRRRRGHSERDERDERVASVGAKQRVRRRAAQRVRRRRCE